MKKQTIVIVTEKFDFHADAVIIALRKLGHQPVRLHTADFPVESRLALTFRDQQWNGKIQMRNREVNIDEIRSVWWRRPSSSVLPADLSKEERLFAQRETAHTLTGVWNLLECYWMSYPHHIRQASNKIEQIKRAVQMGFCVPRTLVTNDPDEARSFYNEYEGQIIYKSLENPFLGDLKTETVFSNNQDLLSRCVYTTSLTPEHFAVFDAVRVAPCQFQELVPKQFELRVTIIGDDIFTCEIHSQQHDRTRTDWRHYDVPVPYRKGILPSFIAEKCFALTKSYGLNFAAIDLILTPDGEYIFLEINPNGQWYFIEQHVPELKMLEAVTSCLIRGDG